MIRTVCEHFLRPRLPHRLETIRGYQLLGASKVLDVTRFGPQYELHQIEMLKRYLEPDDELLVIGGGTGLTAMIGTDLGASVTVIEASMEVVRKCWANFDRNNKNDIELVHGTVGPTDQAYPGELGEPVDLSGYDPSIVEMDIEGAELEAIPMLPDRVETVIVETHPKYQTPPSRVGQLLSDEGWEIVEEPNPTGTVPTLVAQR